MAFKKGKSGNPAGRPNGIPNPQAKLRQLIADDLPEIIGALVEKAKGGDKEAASLLLSRCLPPLKPQSDTTDGAISGNSIGERAESILAATMGGSVSPTAAAEMMSALLPHAKILEVHELERRIAALEGNSNEKK